MISNSVLFNHIEFNETLSLEIVNSIIYFMAMNLMQQCPLNNRIITIVLSH